MSDKKVTLYIPEQEHRRIAACLASRGLKISPLALRLLAEWCESGGDTAQRDSAVQDHGAMATAEHRALESILSSKDGTAKKVMLALLQTLAPEIYGPDQTTTQNDLASGIETAARFIDEAKRTTGSGTPIGGSPAGRLGGRRRN